MYGRYPVILSTTSNLEGWEIEQHLGPISAHMVIGTGLLTDFFSGLTDIFGGPSASYRNKIQEIEYEALSTLSAEAKQLGADAIVGLRVDHDEISGGGKSMMMVTAMGTAVRARRLVKSREALHPDVVAARDLVERVKRDWITDRAAAGTLGFTEADWETLIEQKIAEASPTVLGYYATASGQGIMPASDLERLERRLREFFRELAPEEASRQLYDALPNVETGPIASKLIVDLQLVDLERSKALLESEDQELRSLALQTLKGHPRGYTARDLETMAAIASAIESAFTAAPDADRARMLSSKAKSVWACECGNEVDSEMSRCVRCGRDRYGFTEKEFSPPAALATLNRRIEALRALV